MYFYFISDDIEDTKIESIAVDYLNEADLLEYRNIISFIRKKEYSLGRFLIKELVKDNCDEKNELLLTKGIFNQPVINNINVDVSLAHSGNFFVAMGFPRTILAGIDIEAVDRKISNTIKKILTRNELYLLDNSLNNNDLELLIFWTAKEALSKAIKVGFTTEISIFEINLITYDTLLDKYVVHFTSFPHFVAYTTVFNSFVYTVAIPKMIKIKKETLKIKRDVI
ncbi:4'-phosphopantetheinyl transferase superfamily protein [Halalkalibacter sp. APA_J-10(15)]|uniref:4'-phosphopantetheinyl transferase family protein n=1 Tax=Halalkalibacter sp. APA_J-10(15) TaxID=2933805 RepID=UPI001FF6C3EB|nr:4'-phosphopantetheinyl transferase superfamily protein [Halalkalibacter sp. APA_J-10(15)]MCK0471880.1 4'-phosphopantetheinyl transferase superfamily protein [Halalkalibacter sp. APA_J-10(15)]